MAKKLAANSNIDFCFNCRRLIDQTLDVVPADKVYIQASKMIDPPSNHIVIQLCPECSNFVETVLDTGGFKIFS